ncbi:MAG: hypothetical protein SH817_11030 [Leptospira sp.]|nr:hypothetical protein [Leptospira sp.]
MQFFYKHLFLVLILFGFQCDLISPKDESNDETLLGLLVLARSSGATSTTNTTGQTGKFPIPTCEVSAPTFSTLKDAGFESTCGASGCHVTGGSGASIYRASVISEVLTQTQSASPTTSKLYTAQSTGSMAIHTTQSIDKAIYCWILGGTKQ